MDTIDIYSELNEDQKRAVIFEGKHLLVLAGAGSGKTKTIISRAIHLIKNGINPNRILILSFTKKSANEIVNRIKLVNNSEIKTAGQTFHSWCMNIIKSNPNLFECYDYTCLDEEDRESAIKLLCGKKFRDLDNNAISAKSIIEVYSYAINAKCSLSESILMRICNNSDTEISRQYISKNKHIYEDIIKKYTAYKNEKHYIDYDDMLDIVASGLKSNKNAANYISSQYDHILIDEMQDTNPLQYELISSFTENCHLFCVGDDAQSIYGFRGADFKTIHNFTNIIKDSSVIKLLLNYRSTQEILDLSNWLLSQSEFKYDKELIAYRGNGNKPKLIHIDNDWEEAESITDSILKFKNEKEYKWSDFLALCRSSYGLKHVEGCCLQKKIPYVVFGGRGMMQSKHVRDVISSLRIAANFRDELAWVRYLQLWEGIGDVTASKIIGDLYKCKTLEECVFKLMDLVKDERIYQTIANIDGLQSQPSKAIVEALNCMEDRMAILYKDNAWQSRRNDFKILSQIALNNSSITEFIAEYVLDPKVETTIKSAGDVYDRVILSTIHSAKGLEAKNCYILNVSPEAYPTPIAITNGIDAIEEERRCLYVAMTRAKDNLFIYRNVKTIRTEPKDDVEYYFLNNIDESLVDVEIISHQNRHIDNKYGGEKISVNFRRFNFD